MNSVAAQEASPGDRAAIRQAFVDTQDVARVGISWWDQQSQTWSDAPDALWHEPLPLEDARWRWIEVVSVRHAEVPGRGRWAFALDAGQPNASTVGSAKLVAMSGLTGRVVDAWWFDVGHEVVAESRLADFFVDVDSGTAIIHDAGTAGLLIVDLWSRRTHRALDGHVPAAASLALDSAGGWLSWRVPGEPVGGRVPWSELRDARLHGRALVHLVEPIVDSDWVPPIDMLPETKAIETPENATANEPVDPEMAWRWAQAGVSRGFGSDTSWAVLRREAARGVTVMVMGSEQVSAQKP